MACKQAIMIGRNCASPRRSINITTTPQILFGANPERICFVLSGAASAVVCLLDNPTQDINDGFCFFTAGNQFRFHIEDFGTFITRAIWIRTASGNANNFGVAEAIWNGKEN